MSNIIDFEWYKKEKEHVYWFDHFSKYEVELMVQQALRPSSYTEDNATSNNEFYPYNSEEEYDQAVQDHEEKKREFKKALKLYEQGKLAERPSYPWQFPLKLTRITPLDV